MFSRTLSQLKRVKSLLKKEGILSVYQRLQNRPVSSLPITSNPMAPDNYAHWISNVELKEKSNLPGNGITLSILMPVYKPNRQFLHAAIDSVQAQTYQDWELCIHDDGSHDEDLKSYLQTLARNEPRIKVTFGRENFGISNASNKASNLASGEFFLLMDQDDCLSHKALSHMAKAITENPEAKLVYSDEDKLSASGTRESPYFKPDYNYQLLLSQNYICHLLGVNAGIFKQIGGFRSEFDGAQDHDLVLRVTEILEPCQVHHIPQILYHWRAHSNSTASNLETKPAALQAGQFAIESHLERQSIKAFVSTSGIRYRVEYPQAGEADVTIIIPTRNGVTTLKRCIDSIQRLTQYKNYKILVVDNGSDDFETLQYLKSISRHHVKVLVANQPFNFAALNNLAVTHVDTDYVCLLNDDTEVISKNWLDEMLGHAAQPNVGAVGAKLLYPDNTVQHAGVILGIGGVAGHSHKHFCRHEDGYFSRLQVTQNVSAVTAACLVIKRDIWNEVSGMNENLAVAFNDIDFCLRLTGAGYSIVWTPWAELYHHESISRGYETTPEKQARFKAEIELMQNTWGPQLAHDPHYSPHLTRMDESFRLRQAAEY